MVLKILIRSLTITLIVGISSCSTLPVTNSNIPTEDRTETRKQLEDTRITEGSRTVAVPQDNPQTIKNKATVSVPVSPTTIAQKKQSPAVIALLASAQQANNNGNPRAAQSSLQRAQRIAPQDPDVYYALANIHRDLQDYGLAEQVALKGVSIVQGQAAQLRRFWLLIADIREETGNSSGAKKARKSAALY
ncbi:MAG: hypothetical protein HRT92_09230 [Piscirickettsiaceae bacterium]|nr:hypothetical protein [Piscirickettsiaceae bacterium]